jgi:sensor c-di-GMP phosphodiesterase-like protein
VPNWHAASQDTQAIIQLGHSLSLHTVTEGIEELEQVIQLRRLTCDEGQGYYFARPLAGHQLEDPLGRRRPAATEWAGNAYDQRMLQPTSIYGLAARPLGAS